MKSLYSVIMAAGLAMALSVGAQTTTTEQQQPQQQPQQPAQGQDTITTEPNANTRPARASQPAVQPNEPGRARTSVDQNVNKTGGDRVNRDAGVRTNERR